MNDRVIYHDSNIYYNINIWANSRANTHANLSNDNPSVLIGAVWERVEYLSAAEH